MAETQVIVIADTHKYEDCEFYEISTDKNGVKCIHVFGYVYYTPDDTDKPYRHVTFTFFIEPVSEFIKTLKNFNERTAEYKQYVGDLTEDEANKLLDNYFSDTPAKKCSFDNLTENTPDGYYVNYK